MEIKIALNDPEGHLRQIASMGVIDSTTGLPAWAVDSDERVRKAGEAALDLMNATADFEAHVRKIYADDDITMKGRHSRVATAAEHYFKVEVELAKGRLDGLRSAIRLARSELVVEAPKMDPAVREIRASEVRTWLRSLDPIACQETVADAARRGDAETVRAAFDSPGRPILSRESRETVEAAYFDAAKPDELARVHRLESAERQLEGLIHQTTERAAQLRSESADAVKTAGAGGGVAEPENGTA